MVDNMYSPPAPAAPGLAAVLGRLALGRDEGAWQALINEIGPDLHRLARRLAGDAALADDALQEALLQIRDHAGRFSPRSEAPDADARRWLLRLTANTTLHLLRGRRRTAARHLRAAHQSPSAATTAPEAALERNETATLVREALATLTEPARSAVILHHCAGLGYEEVAAELRVPVGTAKTHVHRGLEKLRRRLVRAGCVMSLTAVVGALDGLAASELASASLSAGHVALIHSSNHASILALPTSGGLTMATIATGAVAAILATAVTVGLVRGEDGAATPTATPTAGTVAAAAPASALSKTLGMKLTFDFQDTPLSDTLDFFRQVCTTTIIADPAVLAADPAVALRVQDMELRTALGWIAKLTNTDIVVERGAIFCKPAGPAGGGFSEDGAAAAAVDAGGPLGQRITFDMQDAKLDECLTFLRKVTGVEIVATVPPAQWRRKTITLRVTDMPLRDVLHWMGVLCQASFTEDRNGVITARPMPAL